MILEEAFTRLEDLLTDIPVTVLENLNYYKLKSVALSRGDDAAQSLFKTYCTFFQFMLQEEGIEIDRESLIDFTVLNLLEFFNCTCYDKVFDDQDIIKLPLANILFRHYIALAGRLNVDIEQARSTFDLYYYKQRVIKPGKIDLEEARYFEKSWSNVIEGFTTSINIVEHFVDRFIKKDNWVTFFTHYLLYRQLLDDVNDFVDDYRNGELKTFGILALVTFFKNKIKINLKNPITAFQYQLYMLKNYKQLYNDLVSRFEKETSLHMEIDDFYRILKKLENFQLGGENCINLSSKLEDGNEAGKEGLSI